MRKIVSYYSLECCVSCKGVLRDKEVMHSSGTCPNCGNTNVSTVVDCFKKVAVKIQINPKWKFWVKIYENAWEDDFKLEKG